jgi:hypothetical protein
MEKESRLLGRGFWRNGRIGRGAYSTYAGVYRNHLDWVVNNARVGVQNIFYGDLPDNICENAKWE